MGQISVWSIGECDGWRCLQVPVTSPHLLNSFSTIRENELTRKRWTHIDEILYHELLEENEQHRIPPHEQVDVRIELTGQSFSVDRGIDDIIRTLNEYGVRTTKSCINTNGPQLFTQIRPDSQVWIQFEDVSDIQKLAKAAFDHLRDFVEREGYIPQRSLYRLLEAARISLNLPDTHLGEWKVHVDLYFPAQGLPPFREHFFAVFAGR